MSWGGTSLHRALPSLTGRQLFETLWAQLAVSAESRLPAMFCLIEMKCTIKQASNPFCGGCYRQIAAPLSLGTTPAICMPDCLKLLSRKRGLNCLLHALFFSSQGSLRLGRRNRLRRVQRVECENDWTASSADSAIILNMRWKFAFRQCFFI